MLLAFDLNYQTKNIFCTLRIASNVSAEVELLLVRWESLGTLLWPLVPLVSEIPISWKFQDWNTNSFNKTN